MDVLACLAGVLVIGAAFAAAYFGLAWVLNAIDSAPDWVIKMIADGILLTILGGLWGLFIAFGLYLMGCDIAEYLGWCASCGML